MNYVGKRVTHARFGEGVIKSCENGLVLIAFRENGARFFHYPEAFDRFLKTDDRDLEAEVEKKLIAWRLSREAAALRASEACAAMYHPPKPEKAPRAPRKPAKKKA